MSVNPTLNHDTSQTTQEQTFSPCDWLSKKLGRPNLFSTSTQVDRKMCFNAYNYWCSLQWSTREGVLDGEYSQEWVESSRKVYEMNMNELCDKRNGLLKRMGNVSNESFLACKDLKN